MARKRKTALIDSDLDTMLDTFQTRQTDDDEEFWYALFDEEDDEEIEDYDEDLVEDDWFNLDLDEDPIDDDFDIPTIRELEDAIEKISINDMVGMYLKETAKVPLLTAEEEVELAIRLEKARHARARLNQLRGKASKKELRELIATIQDGIKAREHLIKANTRLVVSIAKRYANNGLPLLDLIQEGNLGLMKAIEKYDYHKGFRFSTYATWWIRQTITRGIADYGRTIRLPVHMTDRLRKIYRISHKLEQELGRPPTVEEVAEKAELTVKKLRWTIRVSRFPVSLESPMGEEDEAELGMFIEDEKNPSPMQQIYQGLLHQKVEEILSTLTPREARVIQLRYGLNNCRPHTLEEVGRKFGLTRERIRQIEGKALRRLRHRTRSMELREYM